MATDTATYGSQDTFFVQRRLATHILLVIAIWEKILNRVMNKA